MNMPHKTAPLETPGSIDNQLQFMQLANAAQAVVGYIADTQQKENLQDLNVQVAMEAINALVGYFSGLTTEPSYLNNPSAFVIKYILNNRLTHSSPDGLTTIAELCGASAAQLNDVINYFEGNHCTDFNTQVTFMPNIPSQSLVQALGNPSGAVQNMCNGRPIEGVTLQTSFDNLLNAVTVCDNAVCNKNISQAELKAIATAIANFNFVITGVIRGLSAGTVSKKVDGYLGVLYAYITTPVCPGTPGGTNTLLIAADGKNAPAYTDLQAMLSGTGVYQYCTIGEAFYNLLTTCNNGEYGDISQCSCPTIGNSSFYQHQNNPSAVRAPGAPPVPQVPETSGWTPKCSG